MAKKKPNDADPKMLKYLDLLMAMDVLENEEDWETIENLDQAEKDSEMEGFAEEEDDDEA